MSVTWGAIGPQCEVELTVANLVYQRLRRAARHVDRHPRKPGSERVITGGQELRKRFGCQAHRDVAARLACNRRMSWADTVAIGKDRSRAPPQTVRRTGVKLMPRGRAVHQRHRKLRFQSLNSTGQRTLRDIERPSCRPEAPLIYHCTKRPQLAQRHLDTCSSGIPSHQRFDEPSRVNQMRLHDPCFRSRCHEAVFLIKKTA